MSLSFFDSSRSWLGLGSGNLSSIKIAPRVEKMVKAKTLHTQLIGISLKPMGVP